MVKITRLIVHHNHHGKSRERVVCACVYACSLMLHLDAAQLVRYNGDRIFLGPDRTYHGVHALMQH